MPETYGLPSSPPDAQEKKQLRKYYFRLAWIVIALIFVFSILNSIILKVCSGLIGGGFTNEAINSGKNVIRNDPVMKAIYSYGFPILGDLAALGTGIIITNTDFKKKLRFRGFTGGELCKFTALAFGIMTLASLANQIIAAIIIYIMGLFSGSQAETTLPASVVQTQGNPLWLDILIYFYVCLLGPVLEELIFRGVLLEGLRKYGNLFGIIMSSILFGLMHQNFSQCIPAVCMGLVMATMAVKSGSLMPSIFVHILNNSLSAILMVMLNSQSTADIASYNITDIEEISKALMASIPVLAMLVLNLVFRLVCIVASIIIIARHIGSKKKLIVSDEYSRKRTWSYIFTSAPWLIVLCYMLYNTVTSLMI